MSDTTDFGLAASTGLDFTEARIVDAHFDACRPAYLELLADSGIGPGDRVLDAGSGTGRFLLRLAELVGPTGTVTGVDMTPEHVALATERVAAAATPCPVDVRRADILRLPFPDDSFDAVWCANTVQYLNGQALQRALLELSRVVRPGGRIAVKELDPTTIRAYPGDPFLVADFFRAAAPHQEYAGNLLRTRNLRLHLARAGLADVRQRTVLSEHTAPFTPAERAFYTHSCATLAAKSALFHGGETPAAWQHYRDPEDPDNPLNSPDAYMCEGVTLAVGTVGA